MDFKNLIILMILIELVQSFIIKEDIHFKINDDLNYDSNYKHDLNGLENNKRIISNDVQTSSNQINFGLNDLKNEERSWYKLERTGVIVTCLILVLAGLFILGTCLKGLILQLYNINICTDPCRIGCQFMRVLTRTNKASDIESENTRRIEVPINITFENRVQNEDLYQNEDSNQNENLNRARVSEPKPCKFNLNTDYEDEPPNYDEYMNSLKTISSSYHSVIQDHLSETDQMNSNVQSGIFQSISESFKSLD